MRQQKSDFPKGSQEEEKKAEPPSSNQNFVHDMVIPPAMSQHHENGESPDKGQPNALDLKLGAERKVSHNQMVPPSKKSSNFLQVPA
jgi:hypothetical protein